MGHIFLESARNILLDIIQQICIQRAERESNFDTRSYGGIIQEIEDIVTTD